MVGADGSNANKRDADGSNTGFSDGSALVSRSKLVGDGDSAGLDGCSESLANLVGADGSNANKRDADGAKTGLSDGCALVSRGKLVGDGDCAGLKSDDERKGELSSPACSLEFAL